jgi:hypothetical protein
MHNWTLVHNEIVKWWSSLFTNLGSGLLAATVVAWWVEKKEPFIGLWLVWALVLIICGNRALKQLEVEER